MNSGFISAVILVCIAALSALCQNPGEEKATLRLYGSMLGYFNNMEYFNNYRTGETLLGCKGRLWCVWNASEWFSLATGCHIRKDCGDTRFFSDARPLLRVSYSRCGFTCLIGTLNDSNRHGLTDALLQEQKAYRPGFEEGIQFMYDHPVIRHDVWLQWLALNTPRQREHLIIGSTTAVTLGYLMAQAMLLYDHHGGQQFHPVNDPSRETLNGSFQFTLKKKFESLIEEAGLRSAVVASSSSDTSAHRKKGWGLSAQAWVHYHEFEIGGLFFKGRSYFTTTGNPHYTSQKPYYFFELRRLWTVSSGCFIETGGRLEWIDTKPLSYDGQHQIWVIMGGNFPRSTEEKILKHLTE